MFARMFSFSRSQNFDKSAKAAGTAIRNRINRAAQRAVVEALDARQYLSAMPAIAKVPIPLPSTPAPLIVNGTPNEDTIVISEFGGSVYVTLNGATTKTPSADVSSIIVNAGASDDFVSAATMTRAVTLIGGAGNDVLMGGKGNDVLYGATPSSTPGDLLGDNYSVFDTLYGGAGNDKLQGGPWSNTIYGDDGNDTITGGGSDDFIDAGAGNDNVQAFDGKNTIYGGDGNDVITTGNDPDTVDGGAGNDHVSTNGGDDYINADAGNDTIGGGAGNDQIFGGDGNDLLSGGTGSDYLSGGSGIDTVTYLGRIENLNISLDGKKNDGAPGENDWIDSDVENVTGGLGDDVITGNASANKLDGGPGNDTLSGLAGNDTLIGNLGDDVLYGGDGNDSLNGSDGNDTIVSIGGGIDHIDPGNSKDDILWMGAEDSYNTSVSGRNMDGVNKVNHFWGNVSTELDGQSLAEPSVKGVNLATYYTPDFNNNPVFTGTPQMSQAVQGQLGTCYFIAGLASIANQDPTIIQRNVVDLGDGTYGARLYVDNKWQFFRLDGDLPAYHQDGVERVAFGQPGPGNYGDHAMWGPILEKALAEYSGGYASIEGGLTYRAFDLFHLEHDTDIVKFHSNLTLANKMRASLFSDGAVLASTDPDILGTSLPSLHVFSVVGISSDLQTVTIRNPWGRDDKPFADGTNDGIENISLDEFGQDFLTISYSTLKP